MRKISKRPTSGCSVLGFTFHRDNMILLPAFILVAGARLGAAVSSDYSAADKVLGCSTDYNIGVLDEWGPLPTSRQGASASSYADITTGPLLLKYFKYQQASVWDPRTDYAYHTLYYTQGGVNAVLDHVRVNPTKWHYVQDAVLESKVYPVEGRIRVKFLLENCQCRLRVYDLTVENIAESGQTLACDGKPLPRQPAKQPACDKFANPGMYSFLDNEPYQFKESHTRKPLTKEFSKYSIKFGKCSETANTAFMDLLLPKYCVKITYNDVILDILRVKNFHDEIIGRTFLKGYDYTDAINILPVPVVDWDSTITIRFLMDDCKCQERTYKVPPSGAAGVARTISDKTCASYYDRPSTVDWGDHDPAARRPRTVLVHTVKQ